jgi:transcriptional regulator GlxA family with amidase domain
MTKRRTLFLVYDGFELLDMAGPATVFTTANALAGRTLYDVAMISKASTVTSSGGIGVATTPIRGLRLSALDTMLVMGAYAGPLQRAAADVDIAGVLRRAALRAERFGSVCSGAFVLASAGLLRGKRATTHWAGCDQFRALFSETIMEAESLYVNDGRLWTSAGVTTGVDMALAMLAHDHGPALMGQVAKYLVVYAHRPGHQSQFSGVIDAQTKHDGEFAGLISWLGERLDHHITVAAMAAHVGMS